MADDADWLKKNPHGNPYKMSLRRSNRFYAQDMDGSIITAEDRSKKQGLIIPPMPRRSNIPLDKIKEMNFKMPGPVLRKASVPKPVTRIQKNRPSHSPTTRPPLYIKPSQNRSGIGVRGSLKPVRYSVYCHPGPSVNNALNASIIRPKISHRIESVSEVCNGSAIKGQADVSLLSQSKVVNQSTPNEPALLRSILKQKENSQKNQSALCRKSLRAVKRVNFNGDPKDSAVEKENKELSFNNSVVSGTTSSSEIPALTVLEAEDDSTTAFSKSFKPILYEDADIPKPVAENEVKDIAEEKKTELSDICVVKGGIGVWKTYRDKVRDVRTQWRSVNDNLQNTLTTCSDAKQVFLSYERDKGKLYEKLRSVEMKFREDFAKSVDVKTVFSNYMEKMESIFRGQENLEESFEESLRTLVRKFVGGVGDVSLNGTEPVLDGTCTKTRNSWGKKTKRESSSRRRKLSSESRKQNVPETRDSDDYTSGTPENTPARQKKLSRKIENQLRSLFEE